MCANFPDTTLDNAKLKKFRNDISKLTKYRESYLVCGDFNSKHWFWNCSRANQAGKILYIILIYIQKSRIIPSTLDLVLSNGLPEISNLRSTQALSSDHLPIQFEIDNLLFCTQSTKFRQCSKAD